MGGYGSGGLNKTHGRVENFRFQRLDSFAFYEYLNGDKYLQYKTDVKYPIAGSGIIYHVKTKTASIDYDGYQMPLGLARVSNIDGATVRMYFLCPGCARRARYLYKKDGGYQCRKCAKLNYGCQQKSGREEIFHKMQYIVEKKLEYTWWQTDNPNTMISDLGYIPKPPYMRWEKYNRLIEEYRQLVEEYWGYELKEIARYCNIKDWF